MFLSLLCDSVVPLVVFRRDLEIRNENGLLVPSVFIKVLFYASERRKRLDNVLLFSGSTYSFTEWF